LAAAPAPTFYTIRTRRHVEMDVLADPSVSAGSTRQSSAERTPSV
jgi:hypothetical protein